VLVCAQLSGHGSTRSGGAALTIETGAKIQIGPIITVMEIVYGFQLVQNHRRLQNFLASVVQEGEGHRDAIGIDGAEKLIAPWFRSPRGTAEAQSSTMIGRSGELDH
jgi:hypothetical protein